MVATEEKILDIKVEYKDAINKIADYQAQLDALKLSEKGYKEELKAGNITQEEYNKNITAAKVAAKEYRTAINVLEKQITSQIKTQKSNADILAEVEELMGTNVRSIAEAEAANKALREAVRSLSDEEESAYAIRQKLNAQIDTNTDYIRRNSDEYVKQKMNIGAYTESVKQAFYEIKNGNMSMQSAGIIAKGFADVLNKDLKAGWAAATSGGNVFVGVLKLVKTAIVATGIGALLIALTSLGAAFTRTQQGMETFQRVSAMIGATIDVVLDRVAMLGTAVIKVFQGDFKGAADAARGAIDGIGEEIKNEAAQADALTKALINIEKEETELLVTRSRNRAEIERLKQIAEDTTRSYKERLDAAKQAYAIEQSDMQKGIKLQERRLANMLGEVEVTKEVKQIIEDLGRGRISADEVISKLGLSSSTMNDFKQFADEVVKLYEQQESSRTRQIEQQNKINSLNAELLKLEEAVKDKSGLTDEDFMAAYEAQEKLTFAKLAEAQSLADLKKKINIEMLKDEQDTADKEIEIQEQKANAMRAITGSLIDLVDAIGESSKAAAIASKVIALAQIAIDTGVAISKAVATSSAKGFWGFLAEVGPFIAAIVANMASAIKTVKGAKFATGGDVSGAGTATSDSIPAMLSNGESVMTAAATSMFAPILSAFNQAGGGVPIYGQQSGNQAMGEDMLARAFAKGVESLPSPVVSVEEINNVGNRVKVIDNISSI